MRVFVTGMGVISALGNSVAENRKRLAAGETGISRLNWLSSRYAERMPFGEVNISTASLKEELQINSDSVTRTDILALHAFRQAIADSQLDLDLISSKDTALIGASTVGGMCLTDELFRDANRSESGSPYLSSYDCASPIMYLQSEYKIRGIINTINTACSSSANAIMYAARLIRQGRAKRAIAGGTDSLAKFTINGFNSLHILSKEPCRPFDETRSGLNLGEGAAFLVLEAESELNGRTACAEVSGYCNANDAFHPSSLSDNGEGPYRSMNGALISAGLQPADIDFINAHGTGTENNDLVESIAMKRLFETAPPFLSTKAYTGHTLGAAGAIEAVYSILGMMHSEMYPAVSFSTSIPETRLTPVPEYTKAAQQHVMSNSFGFGGNCTSLIFSKP